MRKSASFYFFKTKPIILENRYEHWRGVADLLGFTTQERLRVEWMVFYYTAGKESAALTANTSASQGRPSTNGPSASGTQNTMPIAWLIGLELLIVRGTGK